MLLHSVWLLRAIHILCMWSLDIGTVCKQYTYCASNIHIECAVWLLRQYAIWLHAAIIPQDHILQVSLDAINLFVGHCLTLFFFSDVNITANCSKTSLHMQIGYGVKLHNDPREDWCHQGLVCGLEGWQASNHIAYYRNSHRAYGTLNIQYCTCILFAQYVYCLCIVPISKLRVHNMHIAAIAILSETITMPALAWPWIMGISLKCPCQSL